MTNNTKTMIEMAIEKAIIDVCNEGAGEAHVDAESGLLIVNADLPMQNIRADLLNAISEAGMVIVPVEPTPEMMGAMDDCQHDDDCTDCLRIYAAAIKAGNK